MGSSLYLKGSGAMANGYRTIELWEDDVKISDAYITPTKLSAFVNDADYLTSTLVSNVGKTGKFEDLVGVPSLVNKVSVDTAYTKGTKIASIEVDDKTTDIYMPDLSDVSINYRLVGGDVTDNGAYRKIMLEWSADGGKSWTTVSSIQTPRSLSEFIDDIGIKTVVNSFDKDGNLDSKALSVTNVVITSDEGGKVFGPSSILKGVSSCYYAQPDKWHDFSYWVVGESTFSDNPINITADSDKINLKAVFKDASLYKYVFLTDWTQLISKLPVDGQEDWYPIHYVPMSDELGTDIPLCSVLEDDKFKIDVDKASQYVAGLLDKSIGFNYNGTVISTSITANEAFVNNLENIINGSEKISKDNHLVYLFLLNSENGYRLAAYKLYDTVSTIDEDLFAMKNGDKIGKFVKMSEFDIDAGRLPYFIALATTGRLFNLDQLKTLL